MNSLQKSFLVVCLFSASIALAATPKEAPPMEPPYTNDTEFDPLQGEDPAATASEGIKSTPSSAQTPAQATSSPSAGEVPSSADPTSKATSKSQAVSGTSSSSGSNASASSEVDADKANRRGVHKVRHPNAKKGLVRIEQDGTYVYKVKLNKTDQTGTLRFGKMEAPNIVSADGKTSFATMYKSDSLPMLSFDYDWQIFQRFGKISAQVGAGFAMATGNGRFLKSGDPAEEVYSLYILPLNAGVSYRFQYARNQWVAPYVSGGLTYIALAELRDDNKRNFTGTPAGYGAGGLMFNIVALSKDVGFTLDNEYGVGGLWATAEFRYQKSFSEDLDFSGSIISLGISADF